MAGRSHKRTPQQKLRTQRRLRYPSPRDSRRAEASITKAVDQQRISRQPPTSFMHLPKDFTADWVYGWKFGQLCYGSDSGKFGFLGHYSQVSDFDSVATCYKSHDFTVAASCTCGHYHLPHRPSRAEAIAQLNASSILVRVAASGTIYDYAGVRRAERQVITDIWLPQVCETRLEELRTSRAPFTLIRVKGHGRRYERRKRRHPNWDGYEQHYLPGPPTEPAASTCTDQLVYQLGLLPAPRYYHYQGFHSVVSRCTTHQQPALDTYTADDIRLITGIPIYTSLDWI